MTIDLDELERLKREYDDLACRAPSDLVASGQWERWAELCDKLIGKYDELIALARQAGHWRRHWNTAVTQAEVYERALRDVLAQPDFCRQIARKALEEGAKLEAK